MDILEMEHPEVHSVLRQMMHHPSGFGRTGNLYSPVASSARLLMELSAKCMLISYEIQKCLPCYRNYAVVKLYSPRLVVLGVLVHRSYSTIFHLWLPDALRHFGPFIHLLRMCGNRTPLLRCFACLSLLVPALWEDCKLEAPAISPSGGAFSQAKPKA